jgi:tripartite-type tricarboxylate transporter receptor subunit TctC
MTLSRRRTLAALAIASLGTTAAGPVLAQAYPAKPITFVVPFAAGSATDMLARALGQSVSQDSHQPVVVDNRAGANGMLAAQFVARAPADGYTVLIATNTTQAANQHLFKKMPYDPVKDFVPVTGLGKGGQVLVVRADSPYKTVADLVAAAKKAPGKLTFGGGSGSSRMAVELFKQMTNTDILHVPYKSNPNAVTDLIGGQIDLMITDTATGVPHVKGGKLRALGVSTSKRLAMLPDVPTISEAGVPGYQTTAWGGIVGPAGLPKAIVDRLHREIVAAMRSPGIVKRFAELDTEPVGGSPEEFAVLVKSERPRWAEVIRKAGATID